MRNAAVERLRQLAVRDRNILLISGDLGYGVLDRFREEMPEQFFNAGICEQSMSSMAAGLALEGKCVCTYSIANFPTIRCLEQIRNDICYHNANVKILAVGAGFGYGSLGMSHHATEDIAILRALPNMRVYTPCDRKEAELAMEEALIYDGPCYIRLDKGGSRDIHSDSEVLSGGKAFCIQEGEKLAVLAVGAVAEEALEAVQQLNNMGIKVAFYSFYCVKPLDIEMIDKCMNRYDTVITVEEHNVVGGFGSAVAEEISSKRGYTRVIRMGLADTYTSVVGSQKYLRKVYGMDAEAIKQKVLDNMNIRDKA